MKKLILIPGLIVALGFCGRMAWAATVAAPADATFNSVAGKVTVKNALGKTRKVRIGSTAKAGDTVTVSPAGQATLQFFDGSELDLKPQTKLVLQKLEHPSVLQKTLKFELKFGNLFARVKKLLNSTSSFEVEAGGTVCGVRGTQFSFNFDPATNHIHVGVNEGTVFFTFGGQTQFFHAGQNFEFHNGHFITGNGAGNNGTSNNGTPNNGTPNNGLSGPGSGSLGLTGGVMGGTGVGNIQTGGNGGGALGDLNTQFWNGLIINQNGTLADPSVQGTIRLNLNVNVPPVETIP